MNNERQTPDWVVVDERMHHYTSGRDRINFRNLQANKKVDYISLTSSELRIHFCSNELKNAFRAKLYEVDPKARAYNTGNESSLNFTVDEIPFFKERRANAMTCLMKFDPTVNWILIAHLNHFLEEEQRFRPFIPPTLLRYLPKQKNTLKTQIEAVKHSFDGTKKIIDKMGDTLLTGKPSCVTEYMEFEEACEYIVELKTHDRQFKALIEVLYSAQFKTKDDLQYILAKRRFHYHFLYSDSTPEMRASHLNILRNLVSGISHLVSIRIPEDRELTLNEVETLRSALLKRQPIANMFTNDVNIALMILSKYWPFNPECVITLDKIEPLDRVFTTDCFQYNLAALIEYNRTRPLRRDLHETADRRICIDPITRSCVKSFDTQHINALQLGAIYTNNDSVPLESLYELQFSKRAIQIEMFLKDHHCGEFYNNHALIRVARLPEPLQTRLLENIRKSRNGMPGVIVNLADAGLSIEQFARLETDKQIALCDIRNNTNFPHLEGLNFQGLISLSAENIKRLFANNSIVDVDKECGFNNFTIGELNSWIISTKIDELGSRNNQFTI